MKLVNIEYSIVSRGTEKYSNCGYMAVSSIFKSHRYVINNDHNKKVAELDYKKCLKANSNYSIGNISFSRFQLITALLFEDRKNYIDDNIIIFGIGNLGFSCLLYLLDKGYNSISIYVRRKTKRIVNLIDVVNKQYNVEIKIVQKINNDSRYKTYIDTTGDSSIIKEIFEKAYFKSKIIILSTPREEKYLISPLMINRKNLTVIGGHEFNGIDNKTRQKIYESLLKLNDNKKYLEQFINIYTYSNKKLEIIKKKKENFIEIFKY